MRRTIRKCAALSVVCLAVFWSVVAPAAMARTASDAAPQAAGWPKCQGTTLSHCYTSACINGRMTFRYWVVWKNILDHEVVDPPGSCSIE